MGRRLVNLLPVAQRTNALTELFRHSVLLIIAILGVFQDLILRGAVILEVFQGFTLRGTVGLSITRSILLEC